MTKILPQSSGIYVHVPFCASRCVYCGFYSTVGSGLEERYVAALEKEMTLRAGYLPEDAVVSTIYLGGGTPSQLSPTLLTHLLQGIDDRLVSVRNHGKAVEEITIECNPDDVDTAFALALAGMGINRVSLGVQTFDESRLHFLRRRHSAHDAELAIDRLRGAGIENISIDLMFGFPGEVLSDWQSDIDRALSLCPSHISAYGLSYEEGTPLERMLREGFLSCIDEEESRSMYDLLCDRLGAAGYEHYEISNFALPGCRSRHNSGYWSGVPYLGLGAAAHSYDVKSRQWNVSDLRAYLSSVDRGIIPMERETLDEAMRWDDMVVTVLRTKEGLDLSYARDEFGDVYIQFLLQTAGSYLEQGLLKLEDGHLRLTREGIHVSDMVMASFMKV